MAKNDLMAKILESRHCKEKKAALVYEDHTGCQLAKCDCGEEYWHSNGAIGDLMGQPTGKISEEKIREFVKNYCSIPEAMFES